MSRPTSARALRVAALVVVLATASACGGATHTDRRSPRAGGESCAARWKDVADSVTGLDQDPDPSALASRWTSIIATVDYYRSRKATQDCAKVVANQTAAIAALQSFSAQLRPYDMTYQWQEIQASIDLYLHDPLPANGTDAAGHAVRPPTKAAVLAAYQTLQRDAGQAGADLQPGWEQMATVSLDDETALRTAVQDLDTLAHTSAAWTRCEAALQVLVAAERAQEGVAGQPETSATASP